MSTRIPNALYRVASPQPRGDLLFALHETGVRLAIWSLRRPITELGILAHNVVIGFGGQKYSQPPHLFSRATPGLAGIGSDSFDFAATRWNRVKASDSCWRSPVATCTKSRRVAAKHQKKFLGPRSRGESSPISVGCVRLPRRAPRVPGKMWDCKTSKMSQSPRAALNAFGLFGRMSHCGTRTSRRLTLGVSSRTSDERLPSTSRCRFEEVSVADVLLQHGEWEFGRFAARYRRLFGELPSETRRTKGQ